jgi:hypothetical protein
LLAEAKMTHTNAPAEIETELVSAGLEAVRRIFADFRRQLSGQDSKANDAVCLPCFHSQV